MRFFLTLATVLSFISQCRIEAKGVFAHFMVGNTGNFTSLDWGNQFSLASAAGIQGFALNMASDWEQNEDALKLAFSAASANGFYLFFSFDYAGGGPWDKQVVMRYISTYGSEKYYWLHDGKPLVSTFEGPGSADDWIDIKASTPCFFMPDWSSVGAGPAMKLGGGVADGLFSWAAWPYGARAMDTYTDWSYIQALGGKPYMMPVSPWFFTNMPGFNKNWLWKGGNLWYERWQQVLFLQPEYVEIISWNDFGESHYVGPLDDKQYDAFETGEVPFNYVKDPDLEHDGWLKHLPWMIDMYLKGTSTIVTSESMVVSHHLTSTKSCTGGGTSANTADSLQLELAPETVSDDRLYIAALLTEPAGIYLPGTTTEAAVTVNEDGWDITPDGGVGLYYTSIPLNAPGPRFVELMRSRNTIAKVTTILSSDCFAGGMANWNAAVTHLTWNARGAIGGGAGGQIPDGKTWSPAVTVKDSVCTKGWGEGDFNDLCKFTCKYGYCPASCVCTNMGRKVDEPKPTYEVGYSGNGDASYDGLCSFACNLGFCPSPACGKAKQPSYIPQTSPFNPDTCTGGIGSGNNAGLCDYSCNFGFCPRAVCTCTKTGPLNLPPAITKDIDWKVFKSLKDHGLCHFACIRGYCPDSCVAVSGRGEESEADYTWVKRYTAIGDSFAAGIGIGTALTTAKDVECSRYDGAYPLKVQEVIQSQSFLFRACTGATIQDVIEQQLPNIQSNNNLITVSAGGNDVGFADVLKKCILLPSSTPRCQSAMIDAADQIDGSLGSNVLKLLDEISSRLASDGIIVWTLYAQFFDESPLPCNQQQWCVSSPLTPVCPFVSVQLRQQFNSLVDKANDVLRVAFMKWNTAPGKMSNKVYPVEWSSIVTAGSGTLCQSDSANDISDHSNDKLVFQRPTFGFVPGDKKRSEGQEYSGMDEYRPGENATAIELWKRNDFSTRAIPDSIARYFHPSNLGAEYQAGLNIGIIEFARDEIKGSLTGTCSCPNTICPRSMF